MHGLDVDGETAAHEDAKRRVGAVAVTAGVALVCSGAAAYVLFAFGLMVHPLVVVPLAVAGTALVAAFSAARTSTLVSRDEMRPDLGAVRRRLVGA